MTSPKPLTPKQRVLKRYPEACAFLSSFNRWFIWPRYYAMFPLIETGYVRERDAWAAAARSLDKRK